MSVAITGDGPNIALTGSGSSFTITVTTGGGGGGVTDHGALTGLGDDDHTQYAKKASNLSDLTSASTARTNLGLGTAATAASTDFATAAQGTDQRTPTDGSVTNAKVNASAAIDLSKLQTITTARLLGRSTSGTGAIEQLTAAQVRALIRDESDFHVLYDDVLESDGTFTAPTWTSDYTDLEVRVTGRGSDTSNSSAGVRVRFNSDTGSNYYMNNGTAQTVWNNVGSMPGSQTNTDRQGLWLADIVLGGVGKHTVGFVRNVTWSSTGTAGSAPTQPSAYYTNTSAAVTSIDVFLSVGTFTAGSRLTVRGRKAP